MPFKVGDRLSIQGIDYQIEKELLSGANKTTYKAIHVRSKTPVVIGESLNQNPLQEMTKFVRIQKYLERNGSIQCNPRIICPIAVSDDGRFIVTNYFEGTDLFEYIGDHIIAEYTGNPTTHEIFIPLEFVQVIMLNCIDAMIDLHDNLRFCHLDLKPDNIMINPKTLDIGIIDIGAGCSLDDIKNGCLINGARGTYGYMSPEIIFNVNMLKTSDVYSLGCVFYELLHGTRLFPDRQQSEKNINEEIKDYYYQDENFRFLDSIYYKQNQRTINNPLFKKLETIVVYMLRPNPLERMTLDEAKLHLVNSAGNTPIAVNEDQILAHNNTISLLKLSLEQTGSGSYDNTFTDSSDYDSDDSL